LMERQRSDYEPPGEHAHLHAQVITDGTEEETRQLVDELLQGRGLLSVETAIAS
jgi:hypothetical protein